MYRSNNQCIITIQSNINFYGVKMYISDLLDVYPMPEGNRQMQGQTYNIRQLNHECSCFNY